MCRIIVLCCCALLLQASELDKLLAETQPPARFAEHTPSFSVRKHTQQFQGPKGPYNESFSIVYDGDRAIALRSNRPQIDLFTNDPSKGFTTIPWPARYHNATIWGTRLTTIPWLGAWRPTGSVHEYQWLVAEDGSTITLHEWQIWDGTSKDMTVPGRADYYFTFSLHPQLGYQVDLRAEMVFEGQPKGRMGTIHGLEFTNFLDGRMSSVWPNRQRYDYTVYTPAAGDLFAEHRFAGWASNTIAGELSDNAERARSVADGGFISFMDQTGWNPFLATTSEQGLSLQTCNVWQDQHNHLPLAALQPDGKLRMSWTAKHAYFSPEMTDYIFTRTKLDDFDGRTGIIIRIGQVENFDDQPVSLSQPIRGATGVYSLKLSNKHARSGSKSLVFDGMPFDAKGRYKERGGFLPLPQVRLQPHTSYEFSAWVRLEQEGMAASLTADTYEWTPHTDERLQRIESEVVRKPRVWTKITARIDNGASDIYSDLRFRIRGDGRAWVDDVRFVPVDGE